MVTCSDELARLLFYTLFVFYVAGTLTGDVFIRGGSPGHCFIVMDVVENAAHKKQFLLAQSFMPAQNIQLVKDSSPWFSLERSNNLAYGELIDAKYLRRFE